MRLTQGDGLLAVLLIVGAIPADTRLRVYKVTCFLMQVNLPADRGASYDRRRKNVDEITFPDTRQGSRMIDIGHGGSLGPASPAGISLRCTHWNPSCLLMAAISIGPPTVFGRVTENLMKPMVVSTR